MERDAVLFSNEAFYRAFADRDFAAMDALWSRRHSTKFNGASYVVQRAAAAAYSPAGLEQTRAQIAFYAVA